MVNKLQINSDAVEKIGEKVSESGKLLTTLAKQITSDVVFGPSQVGTDEQYRAAAESFSRNISRFSDHLAKHGVSTSAVGNVISGNAREYRQYDAQASANLGE